MERWIVSLIESLGYMGIGLLMFLENVIPPIPSELIMPLAGFAISQGKLALLPVLVAGIVGTLAGTGLWYIAGRYVEPTRLQRWLHRYGKWLAVSEEDVQKSMTWFNRHGHRIVFYGRLLPAIRTLVSLPAGMYGMHPMPFLIYSTLGTTLWVGFLTALGYLLGEHYHLVADPVDWLTKLVVVGCAGLLAFWLGRRLWRRRTQPKDSSR